MYVPKHKQPHFGWLGLLNKYVIFDKFNNESNPVSNWMHVLIYVAYPNYNSFNLSFL